MKKIYMLIMALVFTFVFSSCSFNEYRYENYENYQSGSDVTLNSEIQDIEVNWVNGNITIVQENSNELNFKELNQGIYPLYYLLDGTTLKIEFVKNGTSNNVFNNLHKDLYISLPLNVNVPISFDCTLINGNLSADSNLAFKDLNIDLINGNVDFKTIIGKEIEIESVNGNIEIGNLNCDSLKIDTVNGNFELNGIEKAIYIDIDSVNGDDEISVPESLGYEVNFESFRVFASEYNNLYFYGKKLVKIDYDSVNGTLLISKQ